MRRLYETSSGKKGPMIMIFSNNRFRGAFSILAAAGFLSSVPFAQDTTKREPAAGSKPAAGSNAQTPDTAVSEPPKLGGAGAADSNGTAESVVGQPATEPVVTDEPSESAPQP